MKWAYSIQQKIKAASLLAVVCVIVLLKSFYDQYNVDKLGDSFSSVYVDRLLVESYIYKLSEHLYQKKMIVDDLTALNNTNFVMAFQSHHAAIDSIISDYEKTRFTASETICFNDLKEDLAKLKAIEMEYINQTGGSTQFSSLLESMDRAFISASANLHLLSDIQVSEGKIMNDNSKKIVAGSSLLTNLELAILIFIGLMIQVLIMASKPILPRTQERHMMN